MARPTMNTPRQGCDRPTADAPTAAVTAAGVVPFQNGVSAEPLAANARQAPSLSDALTAAGETAYHCDFGRGTVTLSNNASKVLDNPELDGIKPIAALHALMSAADIGQLSAAMMGSGTSGRGPGTNGAIQPYRVRYPLKANPSRGASTIWVEDQGAALLADDGTPISATGVLRRIDERVAAERDLNALVARDALTGLANRTHLFNAVSRTIAGCRALDTEAGFLLAAIDNLTVVNDTLGFAAGDAILRIVGERIARDLREDDLAGRFSANKFGVMLAASSRSELLIVAERLRDVVNATPIVTDHGRLHVSMTLGGVVVPGDAGTADEAFAAALEVLDATKGRAQNTAAIYAPDPQRALTRSKNVETIEAIVAAFGRRPDASCATADCTHGLQNARVPRMPAPDAQA